MSKANDRGFDSKNRKHRNASDEVFGFVEIKKKRKN